MVERELVLRKLAELELARIVVRILREHLGDCARFSDAVKSWV